MCVCMYVCRFPCRPEEGIGAPVAGGTGEPPDVGACRLEVQQVLLTMELYLWSHYCLLIKQYSLDSHYLPLPLSANKNPFLSYPNLFSIAIQPRLRC